METISEKLQYLNETKQQIKQAIINKGQEVSDEDSFRSYVDKINGISTLSEETVDATVTAEDIAEGKVAYANGERVVGTIPNNGEINIEPSIEDQVIPAGYTSGGIVAGDSNLVANNIRLGTTIFGVEGNLEADKPDQVKTVAPTTEEQLITPDTGYELASVTVEAVTNNIDSNIIAENIKKDVSILGVTGTLESGGSSDYNAKLVATNGKINAYITEISKNLDTSSVTNMTQMFYNCTNLTTIPLLDTSKVTIMSDMFNGCSNLTTIPLLDTSKVTRMSHMFENCTNLTTIPQLNTSKVTIMSDMFNGCSNLTTIPLLDTSNATNMSWMFNNCSSLTTIPLLNTSKVTDMGWMFNGCTNLATIPLLDTSNVTIMSDMFDYCVNLTTIPLLDTSNATNMSWMFNYCVNLTTIPQLNTSKVTNMNAMFNYCVNLTTIPLLDTSNVTNMNAMFSGCSNLTDDSLNNIMQMCINSRCSTRTLYYIGLTQEQANKCKTLSNYSAFTAAGWTTGY